MEQKVDKKLLLNFRSVLGWNFDQNLNSKPEKYSGNKYNAVGIIFKST